MGRLGPVPVSFTAAVHTQITVTAVTQPSRPSWQMERPRRGAHLSGGVTDRSPQRRRASPSQALDSGTSERGTSGGLLRRPLEPVLQRGLKSGRRMRSVYFAAHLPLAIRPVERRTKASMCMLRPMRMLTAPLRTPFAGVCSRTRELKRARGLSRGTPMHQDASDGDRRACGGRGSSSCSACRAGRTLDAVAATLAFIGAAADQAFHPSCAAVRLARARGDREGGATRRQLLAMASDPERGKVLRAALHAMALTYLVLYLPFMSAITHVESVADDLPAIIARARAKASGGRVLQYKRPV